MRQVELLAPARDFATARSAIDCGADAVYIGARSFGARRAAGNATSEIERTCRYARLFGARVYVTLNTLVFEHELPEAEALARELIAAGADALIVQDMAFVRMGLGVELHASTQTTNASPEKVRFLQECGFSRVILERGLTLDEIGAIRAATEVELECFVHGAVCVGHSGACYLSRSMGARSGNRGDCAQPCRLACDLVDGDGRTVIADAHLLSLRDLDLSARIPELVEAGINSFKIEGRLKGQSYVMNTVAHYRQLIDRCAARASFGVSKTGFDPDPQRSFTRGGSEYYLDGRAPGMASFRTPKAVGRFVGRVTRVGGDFFEMEGEPLAPGDGICFGGGSGCDLGIAASNSQKAVTGCNINKVEANRVWPNRMDGVAHGVEIYRNFDKAFNDALEKARPRREIPAVIEVEVSLKSLRATATDSAGRSAAASLDGPFERADRPAPMAESIKRQMARSGDTVFAVDSVRVSGEPVPFVPASALNALRRELLERLAETPIPARQVAEQGERGCDGNFPWPATEALPLNVVNSLARSFYADHGVARLPPPLELAARLTGQTVMTTPYCLRREIGQCLVDGATLPEPLALRYGRHSYRLRFDCRRCMMEIIA
ncbi:MAG: U32 family peptidase [Rikenellaceae bacterium]|jgi:putative protease|nr:U32 family peptidase [Rikenellaceae bacterium]